MTIKEARMTEASNVPKGVREYVAVCTVCTYTLYAVCICPPPHNSNAGNMLLFRGSYFAIRL